MSSNTVYAPLAKWTTTQLVDFVGAITPGEQWREHSGKLKYLGMSGSDVLNQLSGGDNPDHVNQLHSFLTDLCDFKINKWSTKVLLDKLAVRCAESTIPPQAQQPAPPAPPVKEKLNEVVKEEEELLPQPSQQQSQQEQPAQPQQPQQTSNESASGNASDSSEKTSRKQSRPDGPAPGKSAMAKKARQRLITTVREGERQYIGPRDIVVYDKASS